MWNPFKKSNNNQKGDSQGGGFAANPHTKKNDDNNKVNVKDKFFGMGASMMMRIAQKKIEKMGPKERENMMKEAFNPKNRDKLLSAMEMMKKSGRITDEQYEEAKKKLGF